MGKLTTKRKKEKGEKSKEEEETLLVGFLKLATCVLGIYFGFILYTMELETVLYKTYKNGKKNKSVTFAMFVQASLCVLISGLFLLFTGELKSTIQNLVFNKIKLTIRSPVLIFFGMLFTNLSLKLDVNYLLFTMVKSSKCLAVMLLTYFFPIDKGKASLSKKELIFGYIITAGLIIFNISGGKSMGEIKILGATVTFIGAIFDSLASRNDGTVRKLMAPSPFQMMFYTCLWVSILAFFTGFISGENKIMMELFYESPDALYDQIKLSSLNVIGQLFIYLTIAWLGPIYLVLITTTRKVFSLVVSVIAHGHPVNLGKAVGMVCVCIGLLLFAWNSYAKKMEKMRKLKKVK